MIMTFLFNSRFYQRCSLTYWRERKQPGKKFQSGFCLKVLSINLKSHLQIEVFSGNSLPCKKHFARLPIGKPDKKTTCDFIFYSKFTFTIFQILIFSNHFTHKINVSISFKILAHFKCLLLVY